MASGPRELVWTGPFGPFWLTTVALLSDPVGNCADNRSAFNGGIMGFGVLLAVVAEKGLDPALLSPGLLSTHVPAAVAEVYSVADGVDAAEWTRRYGGSRPCLLPALELPASDEAHRLRSELAAVAAETGARWEGSWWPLLVAHPGHVIAVDEHTGSVWNVFWEATVVEPVAPSLEDYWAQCARFVEGFAFDTERGLWREPAGWEGPDGPWAAALPVEGGTDLSDWRDHTVTDALAAIVEIHRSLRSGVVDQLRPPASDTDLDLAEEVLGVPLHPQVRELYLIADGLAGNDGSGVEGLRLLPSLRFQPVVSAAEAARANREARTRALGPGSWRAGWLPVFTESRSGRGVHVDCASAGPEVWRVEWNPAVADLPGHDVGTAPIAPSLAAFLIWCARAMSRMRLAPDPTEHGRLRDAHYNDDVWVNVTPPFGPRSTW